MSPSETRTDALADVAATLEAHVDRVIHAAETAPQDISAETLRSVVTAAARLHARFAEASGAVDPLRADVSPTEAVDLACGLLRARDLNPFDLALWFSRPA
ncbi:hypothetical protein [Amycolatopsis thermophila]|uniref:Uncharacterized protein n=1 Tax=Amycolatopsis thermophila TaxID=206084 RepID=A0ABU0F605_9PSEU|nr:hypothetical protein [Amycolatopsis thermophila]MDQ0383027.1 hypothetical protein [Amycolatopsis thermophila]